MKATDDTNSDHDLKAYLDGRDGVSAAYRETAQEEPPRALDAAILQAARKHARPSTAAWYAKRRPYAIAASFMIAVIAVSLYFSALDEIVVPSAIEQATVRAVELRSAERSADADDAAKAAAEAAVSAETQSTAAAPAPAFDTRRLAPPVRTVGATPVAPPAVRETRSEAFARRPEPPVPLVITGPLLEQIEADAAAQTQQGPTADSGREENALEEIVVSGSRIRDDEDRSYRESREDWLDAISAMAKEVEASARLVTARAATARLEAELEEEIALFLDAYPDTDIEAELDAREE